MAGEELFLHRAAPHSLPEWMDEPCSLETLRGCLRSLEQINRLTVSYRPTLKFLGRAHLRAGERGLQFTAERPMRVLDVGSGGGDTLVRIGRWAAIRRIPVALTGVDLNPQSAVLARETEARNASRNPRLQSGPIHWLTADALAIGGDEAPDVILSSLFMHHLEDGEIARVLRWQNSTARVGWFVNDLMRDERTVRLYNLLATLLRLHPFVRHDGPVSFRRAFRQEDWRRLLAQAEIPLGEVRLLPTRPARLCLEHLR